MQSNIRLRRSLKFESLESRIVFSADPIFSGSAVEQEIAAVEQEIAPFEAVEQFSLLDMHQETGAEHVYQNYGFKGSGQTVVIIDSGIAWDHYALGSGFGSGHRVVGGWDFAEGDANPYDDGSAGYHGTHVAGIIASDAPDHRGIAPQVDLIGLRVFTDNGLGNLDWVEQALQWVHDHKNDFANPITTVNLSLGVDWHENSIPEWATLEDEFAQLQADNIFVSVAAGNGFQDQPISGLAYPASSQHVIPVASYGEDGFLSDFSQRNERVLVAPGESIRSTVPDHLFGNSQNPHSTLSASGTSMAAPYVAGASVILRQAMEFSGIENVNQSMLYDHFRETANHIFDATTGQQYHQINLAAAVDAVISDKHGASAATATDLGDLEDPTTVTGTIGQLSDIDTFVFSPSITGKLKVQINASHDLVPELYLDGHSLDVTGNSVDVNVQAGKNYTLSLKTRQGIGHYHVDLEVSPHHTTTALGVVNQEHVLGNLQSGESWYQMEAQRTGIMTLIASQGPVNLELYDSSMNLLATANAVNQSTRLDAMVTTGQAYFARVSGSAAQFDLLLDNSIGISGKHLMVNGGGFDDSIHFEYLPNHWVQVSVNQTDYLLDGSKVEHVSILGLNGHDTLNLNLQSHRDEIYVEAGSAFITNSRLTIDADGFADISISGDKSDRIVFLDSEGTDHFFGSESQNSMRGAHYYNRSKGIVDIMAVSRRGNDSARIWGLQDSNQFLVTENHLQQNSVSVKRTAIGFANLAVHGGSAEDTLVVHGGLGRDVFHAFENQASAIWHDSNLAALGIDLTIFVANDAEDRITLQGGDDHERVFSTESTTIMESDDYKNVALNSGKVVVDAGTGYDTARIQDSHGNDHVRASDQRVSIVRGNTSREFSKFDSATIVAQNGGIDFAIFEGSQNRDIFLNQGNSAYAWNAHYHVGMIGFEQLHIDGRGGQDVAVVRGDSGNNEFQITRHETTLAGTDYSVTLTGFESQRLHGQGGNNAVVFKGFQDEDQLAASGTVLNAVLNDKTIRAESFIWMEAATDEGQSASKEIEAVDFWYALHGLWED